MGMSNAEAARHFANLPPDEPAEILLVNCDTEFAEICDLDEPGSNADEIGNADELLERFVGLPVVTQKY